MPREIVMRGGRWNGLAVFGPLALFEWRRLALLGECIGQPSRSWKIFVSGVIWRWLPCSVVSSVSIIINSN